MTGVRRHLSGRADHGDVRRANLALVVRVLRSGPRTRAGLAADTTLTKATVSSLVGELVDRGLVRDSRLAPAGAVGRPGQQVDLVGERVIGVGLEVNVDYLAAIALDLRGSTRAALRQARDVPTGIEEAVDQAAALVTDVTERALVPGTSVLAGVGVAAPGLVDVAAGVIRVAPNLGWREVPFRDLLLDRLRQTPRLWAEAAYPNARVEAAPAEAGAVETPFVEAGLASPGPTSPSQVNRGQIDRGQVSRTRSAAIGDPSRVGARTTNPSQGDHHQTDPSQIDLSQIDPSQADSSQSHGAASIPVPVLVDNEANLATLAEYSTSDAADRDLVYVTGGVGVGGGIVVHGRVVRGHAGFAGEVGHLPVEPTGEWCGCGRRGCWETTCGLETLLRLAADPGDVVRDHDRDLDERLDLLLDRARSGDQRTLRAIERVGRALGHGASMLVNLVNPRVLVLGGYFARLGEFLLPLVEAELANRVVAPDLGGCRVALSRLGLAAAATGAAYAVLQPILDDPTLVPMTSVRATSLPRKETG